MSLYNVLIVDDEPYIAQCLYLLLDSQKDMDLNISCACSAEEALNVFERQRIDILMSDIQLGDISGIDLLKIVKKRWPFCKTLLITAYNNFDYIYEASQLGIVSYIMKTEKDEHIVAEVKRAIGLIEKELNQSQLIFNDADLHAATTFIRRDLFFSVLNNYSDFSKTDQSYTLKALGFFAPYDHFCFLCGRLSDYVSTDRWEDINKLAKAQYAVKMVMSSFITSHLPACSCAEKGYMMYWIMQYRVEDDSDDQDKNFISWLNGMLETAQESCMKTSGIRVSFILSGPIHSPSLLVSAYEKSMRFVSRSLAQQNDFVYLLNADEDEAAVTADFDIEIICSLMNTCLEKGQHSEFLRLFTIVCDHLKKKTDNRDSKYNEYYFSLALLLKQFIEHRKLANRIEPHISLAQLFDPASFQSVGESVNYLARLADFVVLVAQEEIDNQPKEIILDIKKYIDDHTAEKVSLQDLSELCGYNVNYISRLFRKTTGMNLSSYIAKQKMDYIEKLMCDKDLSINEIMEQANFDSRSYFNRFIKRMTGKAPQQLRDGLSKTYDSLGTPLTASQG